MAEPMLAERITEALRRITSGAGMMRIPADPSDPDLVLVDCQKDLERLTKQVATLTDLVGTWVNIAKGERRNVELLMHREDVCVDALKAILPWIPKSKATDGGPESHSENVAAADKVRAALSMFKDQHGKPLITPLPVPLPLPDPPKEER